MLMKMDMYLCQNVDVITEMVNMISATRAYVNKCDCNKHFKNMAMKALEIGR